MNIEPRERIVYLKLEEAKAGMLDTSSRQSSVEYGEVLAVGEGIKDLQKGDKVFVKSWALDQVVYQDKKYWFVNVETGGILAKVK